MGSKIGMAETKPRQLMPIKKQRVKVINKAMARVDRVEGD